MWWLSVRGRARRREYSATGPCTTTTRGSCPGNISSRPGRRNSPSVDSSGMEATLRDPDFISVHGFETPKHVTQSVSVGLVPFNSHSGACQCTVSIDHAVSFRWIKLYTTSHALTRGTSRLRMSETEPKWSVFKTSCFVFGGRIRGFTKVTTVNVVTVS